MKTWTLLRTESGNRFPHLVLAGLAALIVYLSCALLILDPTALWSPDEGAKLLQLHNLRFEEHHLLFDIAYTGQSLDPNLDYALANIPSNLLSVAKGHILLERLPIFTLLSLPFYRLAGMRGLYLIPALAGALTAPLTLALVGCDERRDLNWVVAWGLISFGSPVFVYSILFWEHTPAVVLALVGMWACMQISFGKGGKQSRKAILAILAASMLSAAAYLRLETLLLSAALLVACWLLVKGQRGWLVWIASALGLALLCYQPLHAIILGGESLPANARYLYRPLAYLKSAGWQALPDLLVGPPAEEGIHPGWMGVVVCCAALIVLFASLWPKPNLISRKIVYFGLAINGLAGAYFLLTPTPYRAAHSLLFTTPWALLGVAYARLAWQEGGLRIKTILLTAGVGLLAYTLMMVAVRGSSPHGGLEWGARFALPFYPLLAILVAWGWKHESGLARLIPSFLICLGFAFQIRGLLTIRQDKQINAALNLAILSSPEENLVTDLWWIMPNAAPFYPAKAIYNVDSPTRAAEWVERARAQDIHTFDLATLDFALPTAIQARLPGYVVRIRELTVIQDLLIFKINIDDKSGAIDRLLSSPSQTIRQLPARQGYN